MIHDVLDRSSMGEALVHCIFLLLLLAELIGGNRKFLWLHLLHVIVAEAVSRLMRNIPKFTRLELQGDTEFASVLKGLFCCLGTARHGLALVFLSSTLSRGLVDHPILPDAGFVQRL